MVRDQASRSSSSFLDCVHRLGMEGGENTEEPARIKAFQVVIGARAMFAVRAGDGDHWNRGIDLFERSYQRVAGKIPYISIEDRAIHRGEGAKRFDGFTSTIGS